MHTSVRGGPTARGETDLLPPPDRQLICSGAREGGAGDGASHLSDEALEAWLPPHLGPDVPPVWAPRARGPRLDEPPGGAGATE